MALFTDPTVGINDAYLRRAFSLAERGRGSVSPNPLVGCVVVSQDTIVGEGYHARGGGPHAEVVALDAAGAAARGSHVYVTLEPCSHFGKTPPCVDRLLADGVAAVTIGMRDPNPEVSGGGAEILARAGVAVAWAEAPAPFEAQNEAWLTRLRLGRPFVRVKVAVTLDGHPALAARTRSHISGSGGGSVTMRLREQATAVVVGASTVDIDDPTLTLRTPNGDVREEGPLRIVLSRTSVLDPGAGLLSDGRGCLLVTSDAASKPALQAAQDAGVRVLTYPYRDGLAAALAAIATEGIDDVLVEAGPTLLTGLWRERMIDELVVVTAGGMGGGAAPAMYLGQPDVEGGDLSPAFYPVETGIVGDDAVTVWRPRV